MTNHNQDTFILRLDFFPQVKMLSREQRGDLLTAIFAYSAGEELPDMDDVTRMCFGFIKTSLDANAERYQAKCAKNRENGSRGGRPAGKATASIENRTDFGETERIQKKANGFSENPVDTDLDSESDIDFDSESLSLRDTGATATPPAPTEEERENFFKIFFFKKFRNPQAEVERFIAHYQATGWTRKGEKIVDRAALAQAWAEEKGEGPRLFPVPFVQCWAEIHEALADKAGCQVMFRDLAAVTLTADRQLIVMTRSRGGELGEFIGQNMDVARPIFRKFFPHYVLRYAIPRQTQASV